MSRDKIPVIEMFGPVLQGEGLLVGRPTWFLRTGGCDYRCLYCDSMHAVDGREIDKNKQVMSDIHIAAKLRAQMGECPLLTLSGGNPALWELGYVVAEMQRAHKQVAIETQGTEYKSWIADCDYVTISPKGPGMLRDTREVHKGFDLLKLFLQKLFQDRRGSNHGVTLKVPVFDQQDLAFCVGLRTSFSSYSLPLYISVGNNIVPLPAPAGSASPVTMHMHREQILRNYEQITELVCREYPSLMDCPIIPQIHVLQYGNEKGK